MPERRFLHNGEDSRDALGKKVGRGREERVGRRRKRGAGVQKNIRERRQ